MGLLFEVLVRVKLIQKLYPAYYYYINKIHCHYWQFFTGYSTHRK